MLYLLLIRELLQDHVLRFCPLIMRVGRPQIANPGELYTIAHLFYWDFRRLSEGSSRWHYNRKKYEELTKNIDELQFITDEDRVRHRQIVDEEIRTGRLEPSERESRIRHIEDGEKTVRRESFRREAMDEARDVIKIPGEKDVIQVLLDLTTTPERIRELCSESLMKLNYQGQEIEVEAWPLPPGSTLPSYLTEYADQYVVALHDPRFPRSSIFKRPTTRLKQFWFLSRALAGALHGVSTRTAINLVGSLRPEETAELTRYAKPERKRLSRKHKSRR